MLLQLYSQMSLDERNESESSRFVALFASKWLPVANIWYTNFLVASKGGQI